MRVRRSPTRLDTHRSPPPTATPSGSPPTPTASTSRPESGSINATPPEAARPCPVIHAQDRPTDQCRRQRTATAAGRSGPRTGPPSTPPGWRTTALNDGPVRVHRRSRTRDDPGSGRATPLSRAAPSPTYDIPSTAPARSTSRRRQDSPGRARAQRLTRRRAPGRLGAAPRRPVHRYPCPPGGIRKERDPEGRVETRSPLDGKAARTAARGSRTPPDLVAPGASEPDRIVPTD